MIEDLTSRRLMNWGNTVCRKQEIYHRVKKNRLTNASDPSTQATASLPWALARDGVPNGVKSSRGRPERSAAESKGDEVGALGSARGRTHFQRSISPGDFGAAMSEL